MDAAAAAENTPRAPGEELAAERERQGLTRAEIAQRLHMSVSQIEALEAGDYARFPRGPFLRGFVRNYAKVLGLDAEPLLERLAELAPREGAPGIVVPSQNIRFDPLGERLANPYVKAAGIAVVLVALGFAAMYWWLFVRPTPPASAVRTPPAPAVEKAPAAAKAPVISDSPASTAPPEPPATDSKPPSPALVEPPPAAPAAAAPVKPAAAPAQSAVRAPAPGEVVLKFRFKGESWVEVRDAGGKSVFSRLNPAGSESQVAAKTPLTVVIGNAPDVQFLYNNREFDLAPHTRVAVARFTLQ